MGKSIIKQSHQHNWLVYKIMYQTFEAAAKKYAKGRMLDIGCGEKPYQTMFAPYINEHVGVDHEETFHDKSNIDRFGTAYDIPFDDELFDPYLIERVFIFRNGRMVNKFK